MYFNFFFIFGHFNFEILICGLAMYAFAHDLNSVLIVYLTLNCLYVFEMEFM